MLRKWIGIFSIAAMAVMFSWNNGYCGDLDDGISTDDNISSYDNLGNPDQNINYIILRAKSSSKRTQKSVDKGVVDEKKSGGGKGGGAMNSVVMGPGSNVKGDIIIIDESKGDKTQVVE